MGAAVSYKILIDSCGDKSVEMKQDERFTLVPLQIHIGQEEIIDDEGFEQKSFLEKMKSSKEVPKSSCPSPESYYEKMKAHIDKHIYVVTLSSVLSGSYNAARIGMDMLLEEYPEAKVHIFDSKSASVGETIIGLKIAELEEEGASFEEVIEKTNAYIREQKTYFVLNSLDNLIKNGRISGVKAFIATKLNIKPICASNEEGSIDQLSKARGMNKALSKMVDIIVEGAINTKSKIIGIAHCNNFEKALMVKDELLKRLSCKACIVVDTGGISSLYADEGGVIVAV